MPRKPKTLTYYVKSQLVDDDSREVVIEVDDSAVTVLGSPFRLKPHRKKADRLIGSFTVRGEKLKDGVIIRATCEGLPTD